jgi:GntR family transcriptional regulator
VPQGSPVLAFSGVTYLEDGRPIEYFIGLHRGDRSRFETELFRPSGTGDLAAARAAHVAD